MLRFLHLVIETAVPFPSYVYWVAPVVGSVTCFKRFF